MDKQVIVFVCTGNICRSPVGEYLLRDLLGPDSEWKVVSSGTCATSGMRMSQGSLMALKEKGIDGSAHFSRALTRDLVDDATMILVMTTGHREQLRNRFPESMDKVYLLRSFDPEADDEDIDDPIGSTLLTYRAICEEIGASLPGLISYMKTFGEQMLGTPGLEG